MRFTARPGSPNVEQQVHAALVEGLRDGLEHLRGVSMRQVPHAEGVLQNTARVTIDTSGDGIRGAVSYDTPYAARQHEEVSWLHPNGRKAKYLEDPMNTERGAILRAIWQRARTD